MPRDLNDYTRFIRDNYRQPRIQRLSVRQRISTLAAEWRAMKKAAPNAQPPPKEKKRSKKKPKTEIANSG